MSLIDLIRDLMILRDVFFRAFVLIFSFTIVNAENNNGLILHYSFNGDNVSGNNIYDESGQFPALLSNDAKVEELGDFFILNLGSKNGYLNLGASVGEVIGELEDYTIATYVFIDATTDLSAHGQFVWNFGNSDNMASDQNGTMFFSARTTRFAISETHWSGEQSINRNSAFPKGAWQHLVYRQSGNTGTIFINGESVVSGNITITPSALGNTTHNYIGKSAYRGDAYLRNTLLSDFRVYDSALTESEIINLESNRSNLQQALVLRQLEDAANELLIENIDKVLTDLTLPLVIGNIVVEWESSAPHFISETGVVTRPDIGEDPVEVVLTAVFSKDGQSFSYDYVATVYPWLSDHSSVETDADNITLEGNINNLRANIELPLTGTEGTTIIWLSDQPVYLSDNGILISLSPHGEGKQLVNLTATISKVTESMVRNFEVYVAEDEGYDAYLFAYFLGNGPGQEAVHYAISYDGYNFTALNNNDAVISPDTISSRGGVRDPHILRAPDGMFYMVLTDLYVPNDGWSNHAMVFLKSENLIDWTHSVVNIPQNFSEFHDVTRVWAPQSIYDEAEEKIMVYFSMRQPGGYDIIYYAYANEDFTGLESSPQQLLYHPDEVACIDGDIVYKDGVFHLFFKTEGAGNGIKKAVSDQLTEGYVVQEPFLQQTNDAVEGSCVYRLINTDTYILMYDVYMRGTYQFTKSYDLENFEIIDHLVSMDFYPRHGTVIPITQVELNALKAAYDDESTAIRNSNFKKQNFLISPNPASDYLLITHPGYLNDEGVISVYNLSGLKVMEAEAGTDETVLNVKHLKPGYYLVQLSKRNGESEVIKILLK
ncbi:Por secretion system C-terminal sorting domain-containing protein [Alkalitalea saponilacus]|uniref:Por secretion system C-terminal sorting domain-containing protein n=2 Tax=Alkalitalea saponilacus TaxID=889453 RepID=A0A1T5AG70_9BACT|nr:Por secretion system C-terminal sorting domain-containing protein [Alkalitalea saponilacus]